MRNWKKVTWVLTIVIDQFINSKHSSLDAFLMFPFSKHSKTLMFLFPNSFQIKFSRKHYIVCVECFEKLRNRKDSAGKGRKKKKKPQKIINWLSLKEQFGWCLSFQAKGEERVITSKLEGGKKILPTLLSLFFTPRLFCCRKRVILFCAKSKFQFIIYSLSVSW